MKKSFSLALVLSLLLISTPALAALNLSDLKTVNTKEYQQRLGAKDYDPTQTYLQGQLISRDDGVYKNITPIITPEAYNSVKWEKISDLGGGDNVPLWKSDTNDGSYAINDIINHDGVLYKNLTGTNTDTDPDTDTTNWQSITKFATQPEAENLDTNTALSDKLLSPLSSLQQLLKSRETDGFTLFDHTDTTKELTFDLSNITTGTTRVITLPDEDITLVDAARIGAKNYDAISTYLLGQLISRPDGIYKNITPITTPEIFDAAKWQRISDLAVSVWQSDTNGGVYAIDDVINYGGVLYKNLTGVNTDTTPDLDTTNWTEVVPDFEVVPLWKSDTNGGSYATDDIINYNGILYKNLTGTNLDTTPNLDTTNWSAIVGGSSVNVVNSLNSTSTVDALSAAQGKNLQDNKLNTNSVINSATSTSTTSPVSAAQVRLLDIGKLDKVDVTGTEQFMGYQINGRDVYQKYVSGTSPTGFTNLYLELNGVDTLLSVEGVISRNGQPQWHLISQMGNDRDGHAGAVYQENDDIAMYGDALLADFQGQSFKIVLKYTK